MIKKEKFWGIVYKITDLDTGKFYIGMTTQKALWERKGYWGTGKAWKIHRRQHPSHTYKREVLYKEENDFEVLRDIEVDYINKYIDDKNCLNLTTDKQGEHRPTEEVCDECNGTHWHHFKWCSKYKNPTPCPECNGVLTHKKGCSQYKCCPECHTPNGNHLKTCSKFDPNRFKRCPECNTANGKHKTWCSQYVKKINNMKECDICGGKNGWHTDDCPNNKLKACPICHVKRGHKKECPNAKICPECKSPVNSHKKTCSHYNKKLKYKKRKKINTTCEICGGENYYHKKDCPNYKERKDGKVARVINK